MGLYKMIKADEIAVCVSGLARSGYEEAIAIAKKVTHDKHNPTITTNTPRTYLNIITETIN